MAFAQLPSYPQFDCKSEGVSTRWSKWVSRLQNNLFVAYDITDENRKKALLLTYGGSDLCDIVEALPEEETLATEDESPFLKVVTALNNYFNPKVNKEMQRYQFRHLRQTTDYIDDFYTSLKEQAQTCDFANPEEEIKSQLITGCKSSRIREKGLTTPTMSLHELLQFARTSEMARKHSKTFTVDDATENMNKLTFQNRSAKHQKSWDARKPLKCRNCGRDWPHQGGQQHCPAYNKSCQKCGKPNHFAIVCRSDTNQQQKPTHRRRDQRSKPRQFNKKKPRHVRNIDEDPATPIRSESSDSEDYIYVFKTRVENKNMPVFEVQIDRKAIKVLADSGASINILNSQDFDKIIPKPKLSKCSSKVFAFSQETPLPILGKFSTDVTYKDTVSKIEFAVMDTNDISILGWEACQQLSILKKVSSVTKTSTPKIATEFPEIFTGVGKLKDEKVKLHINHDVPPVAQRYRRIPFHMRKQLEAYLDKEEQMGIIEKATGPTPWVSPIVIVPKPKSPDKIRVCIDMRAPNKAIMRERHNVPTLDELTTTLSNAKFFSKLDLNQGYNQLELHEESRFITTFATHKGLYRYKRLNFGVNSASEIFQEKIRQALNGLNGVINVSDDILVFGKSVEEHDQNLRKTFKRLRDKQLTLNKEKCQYAKTNIEFLGHIFSSDGIKPSPDKVKAIINMASPKSVSEVRSLLGMLNFCGAKFIPDYATLTYELRKLTQNTIPFNWSDKHQEALEKLKDKLQEATSLVYFNPSKQTQIHVDASPVGISGILTQTDHNNKMEIVQFASRALTKTEQNYSQTEREALAVTWSCEHFHIYLYGCPTFSIFTDHKPLVTLFGNPKTKLPARIERWVMRMQPYNMKIIFKPGKDNPADYMSRHPVENTPSHREEKIAEEYVQYIIDHTIPKAMTLDQVKLQTKQDKTLQAVTNSLLDNQWHKHITSIPNSERKTFEILKLNQNDLTLTKDGIILKNNKIVLPRSLQKQAIDLAHSGHQGQNKTLALLREKSWFHGMKQAVDKAVENCIACQIATPSTKREPLKMSPLPEKPWSELSADFGYLPNGNQMLVVMDEYSRYVVVDIMKTTSSRAVIPKLDKIFAEFGIPDELKTDNGPPFNSHEFSNYMQHMGIHHRKITPLWPRANGETERFMRTIKKSIKAAMAQSKCWKQEMYKFLLSYRSTPHSTTGYPPAQLLFGRNLKTRLAEPPAVKIAPFDKEARHKDTLNKTKMKAYADNKQYVQPSTINIGDNVLVKNSSQLKPLTPYEPIPYTVTAKNGSMITASRDEKSVTRNSSFFKHSPRPPTSLEIEQDRPLPLDDDAEDTPLCSPGTDTEPETLMQPPLQQRLQQFSQPRLRPRSKRTQKVPSKYKDFLMI